MNDMVNESHFPSVPSYEWCSRLTKKHWLTLNGAFPDWIFDGYAAFALTVILSALMHAVLTAGQVTSLPLYAGWASGIALSGWMIGGLAGGGLADYVGRKPATIWPVLLYALLNRCTALSGNRIYLRVLRFLTGTSIPMSRALRANRSV